jgi:hypothetical protein
MNLRVHADGLVMVGIEFLGANLQGHAILANVFLSLLMVNSSVLLYLLFWY